MPAALQEIPTDAGVTCAMLIGAPPASDMRLIALSSRDQNAIDRPSGENAGSSATPAPATSRGSSSESVRTYRPRVVEYAICDPNYPLRDDIRIEVQIAGGEAQVTQIIPAGGGSVTRRPIRGFFNMPYSPTRP